MKIVRIVIVYLVYAAAGIRNIDDHHPGNLSGRQGSSSHDIQHSLNHATLQTFDPNVSYKHSF